jgi:hypothetical protein
MLKSFWLALAAASALAAQDGFTPLFNGKDLTGWDGDPRLWKVEGGVIVGSTEGVTLTHNTFLITRAKYRDFVLRLQMKLRNHNSGVQFRSEALPEWVVGGLQVDAAGDNYWGNIYDERGKRGIIVNSYAEKGSKVVKLKDWNDIEIRCEGAHIQVKLNGLVTAEMEDPPKEGVIALQLHRGPAMEAYFRNIAIRELR